MLQRNILAVAVVLVCFLVPVAHAGKVELTTYYPAPQGEYQTLQASQALKIPIKRQGNFTGNLTAGEIWIES